MSAKLNVAGASAARGAEAASKQPLLVIGDLTAATMIAVGVGGLVFCTLGCVVSVRLVSRGFGKASPDFRARAAAAILSAVEGQS